MISGYVCIRNATANDYCFEEAAKSLIPVCEEVVISVADHNDDDTRERVDRLAESDSRFRVIEYRWTHPHRDIKWWVTWLNATREQLKHPMQLTLDADEVLDPRGLDPIRNLAMQDKCAWFHRINYWRDIYHEAPHGRVCGEQVVRLAPTRMWMCSDEPHPEGQPEYEIRTTAGWPPNASDDLVIHHLGFLRDPKRFPLKVRAVNGAFFGTTDERTEKALREGTNWVEEIHFETPLLPVTGQIPLVAHGWLKNRGHNPL